MGLTWTGKKWIKNYEVDDYKTNNDVNRPTKRYVTKPVQSYEDITDQTDDGSDRYLVTWKWQTIEEYPDGTKKVIDSESESWQAFGSPGNWTFLGISDDDDSPTYQVYEAQGFDKSDASAWTNSKGKSNKDLNSKFKTINTKNAKKNKEAKALNQQYDKVTNTAAKTAGGDWMKQRAALQKAGVSKGLINQFKDFYRDEKLKKWSTSLGTKPPYGDFDGKYYGKTYSTPNKNWKDAVKADNIDITERYGSANAYYLYHYTTQGKKAGNRGNPVQITKASESYVEEAPTDAEIQQVRDKQLGVDMATSTDRILNIDYVADEWEKAKDGDPYWDKLASQKYLDIDDPDQFAALFRLSDRDADKNVKLTNNINNDTGITDLEDAINQAVGEKGVVDVKKFGALAQDVLKETIDEVKKAKYKEQEMELLSGFGGFSEIMNINDTLTDSLLGDTGVGGVFSIMGGGDFEKDFKDGIGNVTGINRNSATYNWEKWFDDTLTKRYDDALELGLTQDEATQQLKIEKEFAKSFVTDYLQPRFDESRSMDEFVEYLDVRQDEQNPFQTQDMLNAVTTTAELKADEYIRELQKAQDQFFNSNFYFNPTGNLGRESDYATQKDRVASDWAKAKKNPNALVDPNLPALGTWAQQAYRFGRNINKKEDFANMHYQLIGQSKGFDGAKDVLTAGAVKDYIYKDILPALSDQALESGTVFGEFIKPAEFADEMLEGVEMGTEEYQKILEDIGLEDFQGTIDELKGYITETLQTGSATKIREQIKYLNEKREKPTQANVGITYIEREEDDNPVDKVKAKTALFKRFQDAGYSGTEEEFYDRFMPDASVEDQELLTAGLTGKGLEFDFGDYSDPFAAMGSVESLLGDDEDEDDKDRKDDKFGIERSMFDLSLDIDNPRDYKTERGKAILGDFTKGFSFK